MAKTKIGQTSLERGAELIKRYAKTLPETPGVYRMLNENEDVLYVGKAKALKRRVINYAQLNGLTNRIKRMVSETTRMEFVQVDTEVEALLLEANLIKSLKPRYNILLKDDKTLPYICVPKGHDFPPLLKKRSAKKKGQHSISTKDGRYYGPFASIGAVNSTVEILQRAFLIRNCTDNMFASRTRPCLQYHIKRCTAPCVGLVSKQEYAQQLKDVGAFLSGQSQKIQKKFEAVMEEASEKLDFETAAKYRDRIRALTSIQRNQVVNVGEIKDADIHAISLKSGRSCIQSFFFRGGQNFGNYSYFPKHDAEEEEQDILCSFLLQFYDNKTIPPLIIVNSEPQGADILQRALRKKRGGAVEISFAARGKRRQLLNFVEQNAQQSLDRKLSDSSKVQEHLNTIKTQFNLKRDIKRVEIFDNSHISGTNMVGAMVVATQDGFQKTAYRKFNIQTAKKSDDYGMMREVMTRRFKMVLKNRACLSEETWPDLLLIDGGKGQLSAVMDVLKEMNIDKDVEVIAVSKGPDRNAGREEFHMEGRPVQSLPLNSPTLYYLQRLRDEAHRFAVGAHRKKRDADIRKSKLETVPGVGAKRKKALLHHFGSAKAVEDAGIQDLAKVTGISDALAQKIYTYFQEVN